MPASIWEATDSSNFFSKKDPSDQRLGDLVKSYAGKDISKADADLLIWGYPDDEGIALNGGRPGAHKAPEQIRKIFYKMTPHSDISKNPLILDCGNISKSLALADRHKQGSELAKIACDKKIPWMSLGGGHDYGYADGSGFLKAHLSEDPNKNPVVINFDAHLDVRPTDLGLNSGTPFYRLLTEFEGNFEFFEVGIQAHCNSKSHLAWAKNKGAHILNLVEIEKNGLLATLQKHLTPFLGRDLWVSLDIDAIVSMEAPGCSQSWTTGLKTADLMNCLHWLKNNFSWQAFSIYEVSPDLDQDHRTSKLAALFMYQFLSLQLANKPEMKSLIGSLGDL